MNHASSPMRFPAAGFVTVLILTFVTACTPAPSPEPESPPTDAVDAGAPVFDTTHYPIRLVTIAEGLSYPYTLAFLPDGGMLVTEMNGQVRIIRDGVLAPEPVSVVPEVHFLEGSGA